jgi:hypothetical protein
LILGAILRRISIGDALGYRYQRLLRGHVSHYLPQAQMQEDQRDERREASEPSYLEKQDVGAVPGKEDVLLKQC